MANSNYTLDMSIISTYLDEYTGDVCCWKPGPLTYDDFLTGITNTYNNSCVEDKTVADYITKLYTQCLSGDSADGTHYWSRNADGSISPTGVTDVRISGNTFNKGTLTTGEVLNVIGEDPRVKLYADAGDHPGLELYDGTTRKWILYNDPNDTHNLNIKDDGNDRVSITQAGKVGVATTSPNKPLTVVGDISGTTDLYVDNIIHFGSISGGTF